MKTKLITRINNVDIIATNDEQLVAIRPICDALGIDYSRQLKKIKEDEDLCSVMGSTPTTGADGKQYEMSCLPIRYIFGWLFSINPMNVRQEAKEAVRIYRKACYDALYDHFIGSYKRANEQISLENELLRKLADYNQQRNELNKSISMTKKQLEKLQKKRLKEDAVQTSFFPAI